jgi:hypothetical protein
VRHREREKDKDILREEDREGERRVRREKERRVERWIEGEREGLFKKTQAERRVLAQSPSIDCRQLNVLPPFLSLLCCWSS